MYYNVHEKLEESVRYHLVANSSVHGLAAMANMKVFYYDGDWRSVAETIISERLNLG